MRNLLRLVGCLTLAAVLLSGATARADEKKDTDKKQEKKKDQKKDDKLDAPFPDLEKLLDALGGGLDEEQLKEFRQRMEKMREMLKQMQKGGGLPGGFGGGFGLGGGLGGGGLGGGFGGMPAPAVRRASVQEARLGAKLREPSAAMIDQLDLPKDQGMVLADVGPNSPAAKAGLKANDILLEVNGKALSSKKDEADKVLAGVGANKEVDVVVMRKGKKETLKGLKLPEAKAAALPAPLPLNLPRGLGGLAGLKNGTTAVTRNNDEFTARHEAGGVTCVVKGKVNEGKAEPSEITIEEDGKTTSYASVDKVPQEHQQTVKKLVKLAAGARGVSR
jgi:hypothetical protein